MYLVPKMAKSEGFWWFLGFVMILGCVCGVKISFNDPQDGFFLKSAYRKFKPTDPTREKEAFILTHPAELYKLRASYGPFEDYEAVPNSLIHNEYNDGQNLMHRQIIFNMDVSAHIVTDKLTPKSSLLQLLIHAHPIGRKSKDFGAVGYDQRWCGQLFVENGDQQLSSVCVLSEKDKTCVTGINLPQEWWHPNVSEVAVFYDISRVEQNQECASASNSIVPARSISNSSNSRKKYISTVVLSYSENKFDERRDKNIVFRIPPDQFYPGSKFEVPVILEAGSDLQVIVIKAKVGNVLRVRGATVSPDSPWSIYVETNDRHRMSTVTAFVKDTAKFSNTRRQEVFQWQFEIDDDVNGEETGRIIWTIDYEKNAPSLQSYYPARNSRVTTRVRIAKRHQEWTVPVLKDHEILNTAILTGRRLLYPLHIFAVNDIGAFHDVTHMTACHSSDRDVLKVLADCSIIYLDGNETRGSHNVTVIAKTGVHTTFLFLRVWVPESRLDIQLSDNKLSQIRGWKVPKYNTRNKRGVDFGLLTHSGFYMKDRGQKIDRHGCQLRLQQSLVEVYTRFHIESNSRIDYYKNRKAYFRVTDLVQDRLRILDTTIATLEGKVIQGRGQGRTEIQVQSPTGRVMARREIRVGKDKVVIERLLVRVVSGITMEITEEGYLPGTLTAVVHLQEKLIARHQEAVLDVAIQYSDGTSFPLEFVNHEDYDLKVTSRKRNIIDVPYPHAPYQYGIRAVGEGNGELVKAIFRLGGLCPRKRSRPLATSYVYINVNFSKKTNYLDRLQSDGNYDNRASDRWDSNGEFYYTADKTIFNIHIDKNQHAKGRQKTKFSKFSKVNKEHTDPQGIPIDLALDDLPESNPKTEAHQQPVAEPQGLSPLEIGMYVLLAVFCVAILVFTINCVVFMMRYRRKRMPKLSKESVKQANDWVWIGRSTLERNGAHHTRCSQTLMPQEDFNGNQMLMRPPSGSHSSDSSNSGSNNNSNRNSTVSTYKGSECSIRITANPFAENSDAANMNDPEWDYEAMGMTYDQLMEYFDNLKESTA